MNLLNKKIIASLVVLAVLAGSIALPSPSVAVAAEEGYSITDTLDSLKEVLVSMKDRIGRVLGMTTSNPAGDAMHHMVDQKVNAAMSILLKSDGSVPSGTTQAVNSGLWSDPDTWSSGSVPSGTNEDVYIGNGKSVTYDVSSNAQLRYIHVDGELHFAHNVNTKLYVDTIIAGANSVFTIGTLDQPINANVKTEIIIRDNGDLPSFDQTKQVSRGVVLHGNIAIHGAQKHAYLPVATPAASNGVKIIPAGSTQIPLKGDVSNWQVGDQVVIMGTKRGAKQDEERFISAISGNTITLDRPLAYTHDTPAFQTNNVSGISELDIYIGNATRNVVFRSENRNQLRRGHFMALRAPSVDIRYAEFRDLGRTDKSRPINDSLNPGTDNLEGLYSLHLDHLGANADATPAIIIGNAVVGSPGWGITHHDSYAAINYNFVYDIYGAGIVSEDGNELGEWIGNFVTNVYGDLSRDRLHTIHNLGDTGFSGVAYESQSRVLTLQDNIAANTNFGWSFMPIRTLRVGEDPAQTTVFRPTPIQQQYYSDVFRTMNSSAPQFVWFAGNEMISLEFGMDSWHRNPPHIGNEIDNQAVDTVAWRTFEPFSFNNYRGGYHQRKSLFVDTAGAVMMFSRKSSANSLVDSHIERAKETIHENWWSINNLGVLYNVVEKNVSLPINKTRYSLEGPLLPYQLGTAVVFKHPKVLAIPESQLPRVSHPFFTPDDPSKLKIGPSTGMTIKGTVTDSLGTRPFAEHVWYKNNGADGQFATADDVLIVFNGGNGKKVYAPGQGPGNPQSAAMGSLSWEEMLDLYGTYQKGGKWVMPVPIWLTDRINGEPYPFMYDFEITGAHTSDLNNHELNSYPKIDLTTTFYGNPNVNSDGSFKPSRVYAVQPWRIKIPTQTNVSVDPIATPEVPVSVPTYTNTRPTAQDDVFITTADTSISIGNVVSNDQDKEGDSLNVVKVEGSLSKVGNAVLGSNGGSFVIQANGDIAFDPGSQFSHLLTTESVDTVVSYTVDDGEYSDSADVTVTVSGTQVYVPPTNTDGPVTVSDADGDGVDDDADNCVDDANANQLDTDNDGKGDVCDSDMDGDGDSNGNDNCPLLSNGNQSDVDNDGIGDVCDPTDDRPVEEPSTPSEDSSDPADTPDTGSNTSSNIIYSLPSPTEINSSNDIVTVAHNSTFETETFSVAAELDSSSTGGGLRTIVYKKSGSAGDFALLRSGSALIMQYWYNGRERAVSHRGLTSGSSHHVAVTFDGSVMKLFLDGLEVKSVSTPFAIESNTADLLIGGALDGSATYGDTIDSLDWFNYSLSDSDISTLAGGGSVSVPTVTETSSSQSVTEPEPVTVLPDDDGDTLPNSQDNCPFVSNKDQSDGDGDGIGDACDETPEGDIVVEVVEQTEEVPVVDYEEKNVKEKSITSRLDNKKSMKAKIDRHKQCDIYDFDQRLESELDENDNYEYPLGLFDITINCVKPGETITQEIVLDDIYDTSDWELHKYKDGSYITINSELVTYTVEDGKTVIQYELTDGGPFDDDGVINGVIIDPVGPATINETNVPLETEDEINEDLDASEKSNESYVAPSGKSTNTGSSGGGSSSGSGVYTSSLPTANTPGTNSESIGFSRNISYANPSTNLSSDVSNLQQFLNDFEGENLSITGTYDSASNEAIKRFQRKYRREILDVWDLTDATGYVGITTRLKMNFLLKGQTAQCPVFTEYNGGISGVMSSNEIGKTQQILKDLDMYSGSINNTWDSATNQSLVTFQETFKEVMLDPWDISKGTGYKYKTTNKFLNYFAGCDTGAIYLEGVGQYEGI